jgi:hypothetical protein
MGTIEVGREVTGGENGISLYNFREMGHKRNVTERFAEGCNGIDLRVKRDVIRQIKDEDK